MEEQHSHKLSSVNNETVSKDQLIHFVHEKLGHPS